jgi:hypothetical protein
MCAFLALISAKLSGSDPSPRCCEDDREEHSQPQAGDAAPQDADACDNAVSWPIGGLDSGEASETGSQQSADHEVSSSHASD